MRSHPCARREVGDRPNGRGTEPQDRLGSLPSKASLLSVDKITKAGNQVYLGEDKAFVKNAADFRVVVKVSSPSRAIANSAAWRILSEMSSFSNFIS